MPAVDPTVFHPTRPELRPGARVLLETRDGWVPGTLVGARAGFEDESFQRLDVALDDGRTFRGAHPACVTEMVARG